MFLPYLPWLYRLLLSFIFPDCVRVDMKILSCMPWKPRLAFGLLHVIWLYMQLVTDVAVTMTWKLVLFWWLLVCIREDWRGLLEWNPWVYLLHVSVESVAACMGGDGRRGCSSVHVCRVDVCVIWYIYQCTSFFTATSATYTCHENVSCISP
jgi:hypothetical protein